MCFVFGCIHTPSACVHFNLKSRLVAMETPTNVPLVGNHGLAYCTRYFIALQTRRQHLITLAYMTVCVAYFMFSFTSSLRTFDVHFHSQLLSLGFTPYRLPLHPQRLLACTTDL